MPLTKTGDKPLSSKTGAGEQAQDQTPSESEVQTQMQADKTSKRKRVSSKSRCPLPSEVASKDSDGRKTVGTIKVVFYEGRRNYAIGIEGAVSTGSLQVIRRSLHKMAAQHNAYNRRDRRIAARKKAADKGE